MIVRVCVFLLVLAAGCKATPAPDRSIPPADRQEAESLLAAAQAKADAYTAARAKGLREAWENIEPEGSRSPCPVKLPMPKQMTGDDYSESSEHRWRMNVVPAVGLLGQRPAEQKMMEKIRYDHAVRGPRRDQYDRQSEMLRRMLSDGKYPGGWDRAQFLELAHRLGQEPYWDWELDVVTSLHTEATYEGKTFAGGRLAGKAYLWSFEKGRVLCAASVDVTNSDSLTMRVNTKDTGPQKHQALIYDLENEAFRAAIGSLTEVKPQ
ncbi:MAG: hypothetical protein ACYC8T_00135 [Myxococcaceae bacterium]